MVHPEMKTNCSAGPNETVATTIEENPDFDTAVVPEVVGAKAHDGAVDVDARKEAECAPDENNSCPSTDREEGVDEVGAPGVVCCRSDESSGECGGCTEFASSGETGGDGDETAGGCGDSATVALYVAFAGVCGSADVPGRSESDIGTPPSADCDDETGGA